jgi:hypothetical protein
MVFLIVLFYLSPLAAIGIVGLFFGWKSKQMRRPYIFATCYLVLQAFAFGFVWYCYRQGYQDSVMANIVPQGFAFLGLLASWIAFIFFFPIGSEKADD